MRLYIDNSRSVEARYNVHHTYHKLVCASERCFGLEGNNYTCVSFVPQKGIRYIRLPAIKCVLAKFVKQLRLKAEFLSF